jgi:hypothetical protein
MRSLISTRCFTQAAPHLALGGSRQCLTCVRQCTFPVLSVCCGASHVVHRRPAVVKVCSYTAQSPLRPSSGMPLLRISACTKGTTLLAYAVTWFATVTLIANELCCSCRSGSIVLS